MIKAGGGELRTLRDAGNFIAKLPERDHDTPQWRAATEALMLVAEHGGDTERPEDFVVEKRRKVGDYD